MRSTLTPVEKLDKREDLSVNLFHLPYAIVKEPFHASPAAGLSPRGCFCTS
jgi:hypothetical protein